MGEHRTAPVRYSDEENDFLREFIPGHSEREIIAAFAERFGRTLSRAAVANRKTALGVKSGTHGGQFKKGIVPFNKGKTWDELGVSEQARERMRQGQFKPGQLPHNTRPLLDTRVSKDGYIEIHVGQSRRERANDQWISYAQFVWMQHNGRDWPERHRCVFADHDTRNFDPDNIVPVPAELYPLVQGAVRHAMPYHDRESLMAAITNAKVTRARYRLERRCR